MFFSENPAWCCQSLKDHFEKRLERGLFVFAESLPQEDQRPAYFWLAMRSVRKEDLETLKGSHALSQLPITLLTWERILYCPWCGVNLEKHYGERAKMLCDPEMTAERELSPSDSNLRSD